MVTSFCAAALLINLSKEPWSKHDLKMRDSASKRCVVHYPKSPCLKKFIKVEYHKYRALCGVK